MFIEITDQDDLKISININHIIEIKELDNEGCEICLINETTYEPKEIYREIKRLIREIKNV